MTIWFLFVLNERCDEVFTNDNGNAAQPSCTQNLTGSVKKTPAICWLTDNSWVSIYSTNPVYGSCYLHILTLCMIGLLLIPTHLDGNRLKDACKYIERHSLADMLLIHTEMHISPVPVCCSSPSTSASLGLDRCKCPLERSGCPN